MSVIHMGQDFLNLILQATKKKNIYIYMRREGEYQGWEENAGKSLISWRFVAFCVYVVLSTISLDGGFDYENKWRSGNLPFIDFSEELVVISVVTIIAYICILFIILPPYKITWNARYLRQFIRYC